MPRIDRDWSREVAVYRKLLLSEGGGIPATVQKVPQAQNAASLLIGLGGAGIDCICAIKEQVRTRLLPDNSEAIMPTYRHLRFFGVDTDQNALSSLDVEERFSIATADGVRIGRPLPIARRNDMQWLNLEAFQTPSGDLRPVASRQLGRLKLMDNAPVLLKRVEKELRNACVGLIDRTVDIHVFASLCGGTGSAIFLDVCYMMRSIAAQYGATVYGYFFLPDVDASKVSHKGSHACNRLFMNGYASLQELDYCMRFPENGGTFVQRYKGGRRISWDGPPVDVCHVISAMDMKKEQIKDSYDYSISAVAEYVMDFLSGHRDVSSELSSHLEHCKNTMHLTDAPFGACMSYVTIGASCAIIPSKEINNYLASELFCRFSTVNSNTPSAEEVASLIAEAFGLDCGSVSAVYDFLLHELREGAEGKFISFTGDWKMIAEYGNKALKHQYENQKGGFLSNIEKNVKKMIYTVGTESLLTRIDHQLAKAARDIARGPIWVHRMLSLKTNNSLLDLITRLRKENRKRLEHEENQAERRYKDYEDARSDFEAHASAVFGAGCHRRFQTYEQRLCQLEVHWLDLETYKALDRVLSTLKDQLKRRDADCYMKLAVITKTLMETFNENHIWLREQAPELDGDFYQKLVTIKDLAQMLDSEVRAHNVPADFSSLMGAFLSNDAALVKSDESSIVRFTTQFCVRQLLGEFVNRKIIQFLRDRYGSGNDGQLTQSQLAYRGWLQRLTSEADPLFSSNHEIWDQGQMDEYACLYVPNSLRSIICIASNMESNGTRWHIKDSDLTDRIYAIHSTGYFPLASLSGVSSMGKAYYSSLDAGIHIYEGGDLKGTYFSDWRGLPALTPQSLIDLHGVPQIIKAQVEDSLRLYEVARYFRIIGDDFRIREFDKITDNRPEFMDSGYTLRLNHGDSDQQEQIAKDLFVSSPALRRLVYCNVEDLKMAISRLAKGLY